MPTDVKSLGTGPDLPRSSRLIGQYYSRESAGRQRVFIIWKQLQLPDGSIHPLPSGSISRESFFDSFGSASMISLVEAENSAGKLDRIRTGEPLRVITSKDVDLTPVNSNEK